MPLSASWDLLLHALVSIAVLVVMITWLRVHPFIALTLSSALLGLSCGMPPSTVVHTFEKGFGDILGFAGITIALGAMLGQLLVTSGGAQNLAQALVRLFGPRRVPWAMATTAMLVGLPLFFEIGFVLLLPLARSVARRLEEPPIRLALALLAGLSAVHCLVPPHPGPLLAIHIYGADSGKTLLYGLIAALPAVILAGIVYGGFIVRRLDGQSGAVALAVPAPEEAPKRPAGAGITLATLLLPVALMLLGMLAPLLGDSSPWHGWLAGLGEPVVALLAALLAALMTLGMARGLSMGYIREVLDGSLAPIAAVLLLIGAGGGLKQMLVDSGVGTAMGQLAMQLPWSPLVLAQVIA